MSAQDAMRIGAGRHRSLQSAPRADENILHRKRANQEISFQFSAEKGNSSF